MHDIYSSPLSGALRVEGDAGALVGAHRYGLWRRLGWRSPRPKEAGRADSPMKQSRDACEPRQHRFRRGRGIRGRFGHDVMAHVHAFGDAAPAAKPFIHLGATSAYLTDNADLILMRRGLSCSAAGCFTVLRSLAAFAAGMEGRAHARLHPSEPAQLRPLASAPRSGCRTWCSTFEIWIIASPRYLSAASRDDRNAGQLSRAVRRRP